MTGGHKETRPALAGRVVPIALIGGILVYGLLRLALWAQDWEAVLNVTRTMDHRLYMDAAHRVLGGGPMYPAWELAGPFTTSDTPELYPPIAFALFVPMALLPDVLWWAIPLGIIGAVVAWHRPSLWGWVAILALFILWPHTWTTIQLGNPTMWVVAFVALATIWRWPVVLVLLKPTFAPLLLIGRSRSSLVAGLVLAGVSLLLLPAWLDWLRVLGNLRGASILYSTHDIAFASIPLVAWATSVRAAHLDARDRSVVVRARAVLRRHQEPDLVGS